MNPRALIGRELFSILSRSAGFLFLVFRKKNKCCCKKQIDHNFPWSATQPFFIVVMQRSSPLSEP